MNPKYDSFLFSELVEKNLRNSTNELNDEIFNRLKWCGLDDNTIEALIEMEKYIIESRNLKFEKKLIDKYWWINKDNNIKSILKLNYDEYFLRYNKLFKEKHILPKNLLTLSELICLMDEATFIDMNYKNLSGNIKNEINLFRDVDKQLQYVLNEIYFRFMASYEVVHKSENYPNYIELASHKFYYNEKNILFNCKWLYRNSWQKYKKNIWKSYSSDYYRIYEKN